MMMTTTKFLCDCHHDALELNPKEAMRFWGSAVLMARKQIAGEQWNEGVNYYGNALDTAGILLSTDEYGQRAIMRYTHTAVEMAYVLRKVGSPKDVESLIDRVSKKTLQIPLYGQGSWNKLFNSLFEIAHLDDQHIDSWLKILLNERENNKTVTLH